jgi:hypothetical protein
METEITSDVSKICSATTEAAYFLFGHTSDSQVF